MMDGLETYYADLRRRAVRQLEARQKECAALDPAFTALQAKRARVFSMPAQGEHGAFRFSARLTPRSLAVFCAQRAGTRDPESQTRER